MQTQSHVLLGMSKLYLRTLAKHSKYEKKLKIVDTDTFQGLYFR